MKTTRQPFKPLHQQRLIGWFDYHAPNVLDNLISLINRLLYQRVSDQRAKDVQVWNIGLIPIAHSGDRGELSTWELNAD